MPANSPVAAAVLLVGRRPASRRVFSRAAVLAVAAVCLFASTAGAQTYDVLQAFNTSDGADPDAGLIQGRDGHLYGTTIQGGAYCSPGGCGTIFKIDTSGTTFTTLHNFANSDGANPDASLIQARDGNLYGTAIAGGASGFGTIFKIDTSGSTFTTLHNFANSDGSRPLGLIQGTDGNLYGTTAQGGASGFGTIFKIDTSGSAFMTLHTFVNSDGAQPSALVQGTDGNLYGTTSWGGGPGCTLGCGTIFRIDTGGTRFTTLHSFAGYPSEGANSYAGLVRGTDGSLYGTTANGGASGYGTIFKIDTNGSTFTTLHNFANSDGAKPWGGLVQGTDGKLYGMTSRGGGGCYAADGCGTIFKIDTGGTTFTMLHSFAGYPSAGALPYANLIQGTDGNLYGATYVGGVNNAGVVFRLAPNCFWDVPPTDPFYSFICTVARDGITAGCGGGIYCPDDAVTRAQMAVLLLKAEHGSSYTPPACTAPGIFGDVPCPGGFAVDWIEQLSIEGITAGCGGGNYCPNDPVTRAQTAVLLLRAEHGSGYLPPACTGIFQDVQCTPTSAFAVDWIERLHSEGIAAGCGSNPSRYCPADPNTRGQMAVFVTKTFSLQ